MYCSNCGHQNEPNANFCISCGKSLVTPEQQTPSSPTPAPPHLSHTGRGGLILTFGILSLVLLGPIMGIPAWVMGHRDLKKIQAGIISIVHKASTKSGMILGIIGTFVSPFIIIIGIAISVGISMFSSSSVQTYKDAIINDLENLASNAYQYRIRPTSMSGGGGSYTGYTIPSRMAKNQYAIYHAQIISPDEIMFKATSTERGNNTISTHLNERGILNEFSYTGVFR